jgi:hypothetical protein
MGTAISIFLYAMSAYVAAACGIAAERLRNGDARNADVIACLVFSLVLFLLALALQVAS